MSSIPKEVSTTFSDVRCPCQCNQVFLIVLTYSKRSNYDCRSATESLMCLGSGSWSTAAIKAGPLGSKALTTGLHSREREKGGFYVAVVVQMNRSMKVIVNYFEISYLVPNNFNPCIISMIVG